MNSDGNESSLLDYRSAPQAAVPSIALYYVALACGGFPLGLGTLAFALFLITRHMDFAVLGFFTLFIGCACVFVGMVCIGVYWVQSRVASEDDRAAARRRARRAVVLMLLNFPVAGAFAWIGTSMLSFGS